MRKGDFVPTLAVLVLVLVLGVPVLGCTKTGTSRRAAPSGASSSDKDAFSLQAVVVRRGARRGGFPPNVRLQVIRVMESGRAVSSRSERPKPARSGAYMWSEFAGRYDEKAKQLTGAVKIEIDTGKTPSRETSNSVRYEFEGQLSARFVASDRMQGSLSGTGTYVEKDTNGNVITRRRQADTWDLMAGKSGPWRNDPFGLQVKMSGRQQPFPAFGKSSWGAQVFVTGAVRGSGGGSDRLSTGGAIVHRGNEKYDLRGTYDARTKQLKGRMTIALASRKLVEGKTVRTVRYVFNGVVRGRFISDTEMKATVVGTGRYTEKGPSGELAKRWTKAQTWGFTATKTDY